MLNDWWNSLSGSKQSELIGKYNHLLSWDQQIFLEDIEIMYNQENLNLNKQKEKKMKKLNSGMFYFLGLIVLLVFIVTMLGLVLGMNFAGDKPDQMSGTHMVVFTASIIASIIAIISFSCDMDDCNGYFYKWYEDLYKDNENNLNNNKIKKPIKMKKYLIIAAILLAIFGIYKISKGCINDCITVYNTSVKYNNDYIQNVQEKTGFYDKLWKTYAQKEKITNLNKETFLQVTQLIMENRKDGSNVAWKWVKENQQIPYEQFVQFYSDLSNFIESQREGYFNIEKKCQEIANKNNTMLDTFPNNMYNKVLNLKKINFEYGFTSDKTDEVFRTKKENL